MQNGTLRDVQLKFTDQGLAFVVTREVGHEVVVERVEFGAMEAPLVLKSLESATETLRMILARQVA